MNDDHTIIIAARGGRRAGSDNAASNQECVPRPRRTERPLAEELPELLAATRSESDQAGPGSLRSLAKAIGVNQSYLSRILGAKGERPVSRGIAARIAAAFELPEDYFPEYRAGVVIEAARTNPALLDRIYDELHRA